MVSGGTAIVKRKTFVYGTYEGVRDWGTRTRVRVCRPPAGTQEGHGGIRKDLK